MFIGLENINPDNLVGVKKKQNRIAEYREMLLAWKRAGCFTYAGYILGFPNDTPETIRRDIAIIQRELPLDILEFFCLTPLPGSEDHQRLAAKRRLDGPRPQQIRSRTCGDRPSAHVARRNGRRSTTRPGSSIIRRRT